MALADWNSPADSQCMLHHEQKDAEIQNRLVAADLCAECGISGDLSRHGWLAYHVDLPETRRTVRASLSTNAA